MQYWKPEGAFFVGDCIPFWHDGVYHLFYLLDENITRGWAAWVATNGRT